MSRNRRDRYTFITADEYKDTFDEEYFTFFYQLATHPHPKTNRYHMKKYIVNNKDQIKGVNDYMLTKNKYDKFLKSKKLHEYKLYSVYSLNDVGLPHGADISASKSTILNNNYDYSGYAPF